MPKIYYLQETNDKIRGMIYLEDFAQTSTMDIFTPLSYKQVIFSLFLAIFKTFYSLTQFLTILQNFMSINLTICQNHGKEYSNLTL